MKKEHEVKDRVLVVIPNRGAIFYAWCLEAALLYRDKGFIVYVLDVAKFTSRYQRKPWKWHVDLMSFRSAAPKLLSKIAKDMEFKIVKGSLGQDFSLFQNSFLLKGSELESNLFLRALKATYALSFGHSQFSISEIPREKRESERNTFNAIFYLTTKFIRDLSISEVVTCNGRLVSQAAVVAACKRVGTEYKLIENYGAPSARFQIFSTTPHNPEELRKKIKEAWEERSVSDFSARKATEIYIKDKIITGTNSNKKICNELNLQIGKYLVFFPGSDYEFASITSDEELGNAFTQYDVFSQLLRHCDEKGLKLVVRVHPHFDNPFLALQEDRIWSKRCSEGKALCIKSLDKVNSIDLAQHSQVNIVHSSSISVEIAYLGLPLLVTSRTEFFRDSDPHVILKLEDIPKFIESIPKYQDKQCLIEFVNFIQNGGNKMKKFVVKDVHNILYDEIRVDQPNMLSKTRVLIASKRKFNKQNVIWAEG